MAALYPHQLTHQRLVLVVIGMVDSMRTEQDSIHVMRCLNLLASHCLRVNGNPVDVLRQIAGTLGRVTQIVIASRLIGVLRNFLMAID